MPNHHIASFSHTEGLRIYLHELQAEVAVLVSSTNGAVKSCLGCLKYSRFGRWNSEGAATVGTARTRDPTTIWLGGSRRLQSLLRLIENDSV